MELLGRELGTHWADFGAMWNRIPIERCPGQVGVCYPLDCRPGLSGNIGLTLTLSRSSPRRCRGGQVGWSGYQHLCFFSVTATRRFRPSISPTSGPRPIAVIRRSYLVTPIEPERSTKFSLATSHKRWRRRRPAALPVQCPIRRSVLRKGSTACS